MVLYILYDVHALARCNECTVLYSFKVVIRVSYMTYIELDLGFVLQSRFMKVLLLVLSLVRMVSISKPLLMPGWCKVLQHKQVSVYLYSHITLPSIVHAQ